MHNAKSIASDLRLASRLARVVTSPLGSVAGLAAMGLEKIHFFWYARRIGGLALIGYFGGIEAYMMHYKMLH